MRTDTLCPLNYFTFTFDKINNWKQNQDSEGTLPRAPVVHSKTPQEKCAGGSPSMSPPGSAGLELPLWLPRCSTCSCRRRDAARSWREIPGTGSPRDLAAASAQIEGAPGAGDPVVRGVTAALAGGGFKGRSSAVGFHTFGRF